MTKEEFDRLPFRARVALLNTDSFKLPEGVVDAVIKHNALLRQEWINRGDHRDVDSCPPLPDYPPQ